MKVFISSIIGGFGPFREAAKRAVATLRHEAIMAENFGARPNSPQVACLQELRGADAVVLVLGGQYGTVQLSGLSATHEEYREAKGRKQILAFVQDGVDREPAQAEFIAEMQAWEGGLFRGSFTTPDDLRDGILRGLHDYELAHQAGPVDPKALIDAAVGLLPEQDRHGVRDSMLEIAIAGGPLQAVLRPAEIERPELAEAMHQNALFGNTRVFDGGQGVTKGMEDDMLVLTQEDGSRIQLDERGGISMRLALEESSRRGRGHYFPAIIEETVLTRIHTALEYAAWLLERIDPTQRLTHVCIAARIAASDHMAWRTQREQDASPNSGTMGGWGRERKPVHVSKARAALRLDRTHLAEDILVPLRRQWKDR